MTSITFTSKQNTFDQHTSSSGHLLAFRKSMSSAWSSAVVGLPGLPRSGETEEAARRGLQVDFATRRLRLGVKCDPTEGLFFLSPSHRCGVNVGHGHPGASNKRFVFWVKRFGPKKCICFFCKSMCFFKNQIRSMIKKPAVRPNTRKYGPLTKKLTVLGSRPRHIFSYYMGSSL